MIEPKKFHLSLFVIGLVLLYISRSSFTRVLFFQSFPIAAAFTASYFWIRLDVWRSDRSIFKALSKDKEAAGELVSRKTDSQMALLLIVLATAIQAIAITSALTIGILIMLVPVCNLVARFVEKIRLKEF